MGIDISLLRMDAWNSNYKSHQGNLGLGQAIAYYTSKCIPIAIPLNDTQGYDLVIDNGSLKRVQVKTTKFTSPTGDFMVQLRNTGGSSGKSVIRLFDKSKSDILFVVTIDGTRYEIPTSVVNVKNCITLNKDYDIFRV